ncbi:hypothetical protein [Bacillus tropicus]|uniref:hypothetical protein n=1 Tax=Bacillus tropicus TaxID=2026188 RepID=UPI000B439201|nr:hypothetical protein [Bacillus tropicus]MBG9937852.1 hypothetical protein [Bacillus tropicus]MED2996952.1 hypothetical protein [Bacillus tropicus]OTY54774.1 hypothetical protein BK748_17385 [Bacillus thuringiensis serovar graciosensis]
MKENENDYSSFFNAKKKVVLLNIVSLLFFNTLLSTIIYNFKSFNEFKDWLTIMVLISAIITPFILILCFIFTMFWSLIGLMNKPDLSIKRMYSVILSGTSIFLITQALNFLTIINLGGDLPQFIFVVFSLLSVGLVCIAMYVGFTKLVGFSKKFSKIILSILFIIVISLNMIQVFGGIGIGI